MIERSIAHGSFTTERTYPAKPEKVWLAWSDITQKQKWFGGPAVANAKHTLDFQVGGKEHSEGSFPDGARATPSTWSIRTSSRGSGSFIPTT